MATHDGDETSTSVPTITVFAGLAAALLALGIVLSIGMNRSDDSVDSVAVLESVPPATPETSTPSGRDAADKSTESTPNPKDQSSQGGRSRTAESAPTKEAANGVESFTLKDVTRVEARLEAPGDLAVRHTTASAETGVDVKKADESVVVDVDVDSGTLRVTTRCERDDDPECNAQVTLAVAPGTILDLYTAVGDVSVEEPEGDLRARSDIGSIALTRPKALVDVQAGVGDITIRDADSGDYLVSTGVGQVFMSVANEITSLDASVGTGDIEIVLPQSGPKFEVEATTGVGNRRVDVTSSGRGGTPITADVGVGDVSVHYA